MEELLNKKNEEENLEIPVGPARLVILQPTSFCNIDCSYCYVPDRQVKGVMPLELVEKLCDRLIDEDLLSSRCSVVWHAGEPLTAGKKYLNEAFDIVHRKIGEKTKVQLTIQTNGTLIDSQWIQIFKEHKVRVGVSLDGPKWLHDKHRKDRSSKGSFEATVHGLKQLIDAGVDTYVLAVVTQSTLDWAQEFYEFFHALGVKDLGLIPEEVDGINLTSSLEGENVLQSFDDFLKHLHACYVQYQRKPEIREFRGVRESIFYSKPITAASNYKTRAYNLLTIDKNGGYTTFSPELAGMHTARGEDYVFGNIRTDAIRESVKTRKFQDFYRAFYAGVQLCEKQCQWFSMCGGGLPSNKLAETGRLDVAETMSCRLHVQAFAKTSLHYYNSIIPNVQVMTEPERTA
ncbi:cyclophane-forming radical SAM/SPASM peptide maturase GrrM/OscB [Comamonas aquatica]|uniref:cyclophane-forming radical SAM/SPASM peptide maturase GrrM/OscB n=1 Tax=Comamonas aquatica TaxID=225991 RepID=UPI0034D6678F